MALLMRKRINVDTVFLNPSVAGVSLFDYMQAGVARRANAPGIRPFCIAAIAA